VRLRPRADRLRAHPLWHDVRTTKERSEQLRVVWTGVLGAAGLPGRRLSDLIGARLARHPPRCEWRPLAPSSSSGPPRPATTPGPSPRPRPLPSSKLSTAPSPALGGHIDRCTARGFEKPSYNSCRDRHCPECQAHAQARWIETRLCRILSVHYFHLVFTLPSELHGLAYSNPFEIFALLFKSASETLLTRAATRRSSWASTMFLSRATTRQ